MINCVSESDCAIPPAKSICTDTQLVYGLREDHALPDPVSIIKNFTNRFMRYSRTVGRGRLAIRYCVLLSKLAGFFIHLRTSKTFSGNVNAEKIARQKHEYLTKIKKSERNLLYSDQREMESDMYYNFNNFNNFSNVKKTQKDKIT